MELVVDNFVARAVEWRSNWRVKAIGAVDGLACQAVGRGLDEFLLAEGCE